MKVNMNVKISDDPRSCILAIEAVTREICRNTGRDPAEGVMMLLTAAVHMTNTYSGGSLKDQVTTLASALGSATVAADEFFKLRGVPKNGDNTNEAGKP
ncbi:MULTISPECIES: hypothetical protein [Brucella]|uniref:hypothetical protein n=1 Tax=Brucella TaxID=234 RepID=UPI002230645B|nr:MULTISPECIES: hypothetical protein [Brucella]MDH0366765.1 hypothetical protein [Brucella anthropi]UZD70781.1 hypothetical protein LJ361_05000 [Brucella sp. JSBI001]